MEHYKEIDVPAKPAEPATKKRVFSHHSCDVCGKEIKRGRYHPDEVEIVRDVSDGGQYGGSGVKYYIDMCGNCFEEKLIPWVRSFGGDARVEEYDW